MHSKFFFALALASIVAMPAPAQKSNTDLLANPGARIPKAADQTLGMALSGAVVVNGTINHTFSSGVVSAVRNAIGSYTVTFDRPLVGCTPIVAPFSSNRTASFAGGAGDSWFVTTRDLAGNIADSNIVILNFCSR